MPRELTLRYSELATLADCALKYRLGYAEALTTPSKARLVLGSAFHALMEGHYKALAAADAKQEPRDPRMARKNAGRYLVAYRGTLEGVEHGAKVDDEMMAQLRWMYEGFVERYEMDDDYDQIISVERRRVVPLVSHLGVRVKLGVTADLIVHHRRFNRFLLVDHKTLSGRDAGKQATAKENQLDLQRAVYTASYCLKGPKKERLPIFGALHNTIRTDQLKRAMLLDERYGRAPIYYGEKQLEAVWTEVQNMAKDAVEIRLGRGRALRMYSSPNPQECGWKCQFKEVHLTAQATGRDAAQVALDYGFVRAEPNSNEFIGTMTESA